MWYEGGIEVKDCRSPCESGNDYPERMDYLNISGGTCQVAISQSYRFSILFLMRTAPIRYNAKNANLIIHEP